MKHIDTQKQPRSLLFTWFISIVFTLIVFFIIVFIVWSPWFRISEIIVLNNGKNIENTEIKDFIKIQLQGETAIGIPKDSFFVANTKKVEKSFFSNKNKYKTISIKKKFPNKIYVTFTPWEPVAVWCAKDCGLTDKDGIVFEKVLIDSKKDQYWQFLEGKKIIYTVNKQFLIKDYPAVAATEDLKEFEKTIPIKFLSNSVELLSFLKDKLLLNIELVTVPERYSNELHLAIKDGYKIYIRTNNYSVQEMENIIKTVVTKEDFKPENVAYLDFRIKGKLYVCEKIQKCAEIDNK